MTPQILALLSLAGIVVLCIIAVLSPAYQDNLLQCFGLGCIGVACVILMGQVAAARTVPPACLLAAVGALCFALGVLSKVLRYSRGKHHRPPMISAHKEGLR